MNAQLSSGIGGGGLSCHHGAQLAARVSALGLANPHYAANQNAAKLTRAQKKK